MDPRISTLAETVRLNTRLFRNCLDGLADEQARVRPSSCTNSLAYIAAHLVESRYYILTHLGLKEASPLDRYTGGWKSIDEITDWPTLDEIRAAWSGVSDTLGQRLAAVSAADLDKPITTDMLLEHKTTLGMLVFLVQHDSYHIGQLSLLRKYAGMAAMSYA